MTSRFRELLENLRPLIQRFGITDDSERFDAVKNLPVQELNDLVNCFDDAFDDEMTALLTRGESDEISGEFYYEFAAFGMAVDHAKVVLSNLSKRNP